MTPRPSTSRRAVLPALAALALLATLCFLLSGPPSPAVRHHAAEGKAPSAPPAKSPRQMARTGSPAAASKPASSAEGPPPARFTFDALIEGRVPVKTEARLFQAQKWEPDIARALELPPGTPLQRRTAFYRIPELKFPLIRVDRIYRMDRGVPKRAAKGTASVPPSVTLDPKTTPAQREALMRPASEPAPAEGGELLWDNAMVADHLMVQTQLGVSREQLQRALPAQARIQSAVNARKGLYLVSIPHESDRALELALLALNHESLKKVIWFAEPDFLMGGADTTPNDSHFTTNTTDVTKQWALPKIMAPRAWDVIKQPSTTTIANSTVVAVVDTGVDYTHPDLSPNMYINPGESGSGKESNGVDDDGNGKIDDWRGWNFVENNNDPMDDVGHGTHVAGIIGAAGNNDNVNGQNNTGICGVCWGVKMLPLRIIKKLGLGSYGVYSDAVAAMDYMRTLNSPTKRVAVANHSWGGSGYSLAMLNAVNNPLLSADPLPDGVRGSYEDDGNIIAVTGTQTELNKIKIGMEFGGPAIPDGTVITIISGTAGTSLTLTLSNYAAQKTTNQPVCFANPIRPKPYGIVHVAAAGNSRSNADRIPTYPASLPSGFMISVGASDTSDAPAVWSGGAGSNYGRMNVDIFAPGSSIWSTKWKAPGDPAYGYESRNGTSMAAPFVTGSIALLKMWQPKLTDLQARQIIIDNADVLTGLKDKSMSGGRLNLAKVVDKLYSPMLVGSGGSTGGGGTIIEALNRSMGTSGKIASNWKVALLVRQGKVYAWGKSEQGQLGLGANVAVATTPTIIPNLEDVVMVAAGRASVALKADGTVWTWGTNNSGDLGKGLTSSTQQWTPSSIPGLNDVVWISAFPFGSHYLAVKSDGTLWAWGENSYGQLGDGTTTSRFSPEQVQGITNVAQAEAGFYVSAAITADGSVWTWGNGKLGISSGATQSNVPALSTSPANAVFVAAMQREILVLTGDGTLHKSTSNAFVADTRIMDVVAVSTGQYANVVWNSNGECFTIGTSSGQSKGICGVGLDDSIFTTYTKVEIPSRLPITTVSMGWLNAYAIDCDGAVFAWGWNEYGLLGNGRLSEKRYPEREEIFEPMAQITGGNSTSYGVTNSRDLCFWGARPSGYMNDSLLPSEVQKPTRIPNFSNVSQVGAGSWGGLALKNDGIVWSWGIAADGQLGRASATSTAEAITSLSGVFDICVAKTGSHCFAILNTGEVMAWGKNLDGQLGDGSTTNRNTPVSLAPSMNGTINLAAGRSHSLALKAGTVWSWGKNDHGQLGLGDRTSRNLPTQVPSLSGVIQIFASDNLSAALKADGTVWTWGENLPALPLGRGALNVDALSPGQVTGLPPIAKLEVTSSSYGETFAVTMNGEVWAWGSYDASNALARAPGSVIPNHIPDKVTGLSRVSYIESGAYRSYFARLNDGVVMSWGGGMALGDGKQWSNVPIEVVTFGGNSSAQSTLATGSTADSWFFQNFSVSELLQDQIVADGSDPDRDGIENLLEYALGLDPNAGSRSGLPTSRLDFMTAQSASAGGQVMLFSASDCCIGTPVGLDAGKRYMAFTVERRGGIRTDIEYIIEVSNDLVLWRSSQSDVLTVINTGELLEAYSTTSLEDQPRQFMRLKVRRK